MLGFGELANLLRVLTTGSGTAGTGTYTYP